MKSTKNCVELELNRRLNALELSDDYIGMESCVDLEDNKNHGDVQIHKPQITNCGNNKRGTKKKDFPPPIPLLVRTENLASHMPWVLKRHHTADGRLILTEEKVRHHEYFRAHRSNGRLMLQLVAVDDDHDVLKPHFNYDDEDVEMCNGEIDSEFDRDVNDESDDGNMEEGDDFNNGVGSFKYGNMREADNSAFMFGVAVPVGVIVRL